MKEPDISKCHLPLISSQTFTSAFLTCFYYFLCFYFEVIMYSQKVAKNNREVLFTLHPDSPNDRSKETVKPEYFNAKFDKEWTVLEKYDRAKSMR